MEKTEDTSIIARYLEADEEVKKYTRYRFSLSTRERDEFVQLVEKLISPIGELSKNFASKNKHIHHDAFVLDGHILTIRISLRSPGGTPDPSSDNTSAS